MNSKNRDIQTMTGQYQADKSLNINPLSMLLNGVIDAAVMGGVTNYEKIFFAESYLKENPSHAAGVKQLRQLIEEQVKIVREGREDSVGLSTILLLAQAILIPAKGRATYM